MCNNFLSQLIIPITLCNKFLSHFLKTWKLRPETWTWNPELTTQDLRSKIHDSGLETQDKDQGPRTNPANIRLDEDVLKTSWRRLSSSSSEDVFKTSSRRLDQDEYVRLSLTSSEDVFKTSSRRLGQDQYICLGHTSSRRLQDVFKTSSRRLQNILPRRPQNV